MDDDQSIDFYRIIRLCAVLVVGWMLLIVGLREFEHRARSGPPRFNSLEAVFDGKEPDKPLAEQGFDLSHPFVSKEEGAKLQRDYHRRKWGGLAVGVCGLLIVTCSAWSLWGSWGAVIAAVIFGPLAVAAMRGRGWR